MIAILLVETGLLFLFLFITYCSGRVLCVGVVED